MSFEKQVGTGTNKRNVAGVLKSAMLAAAIGGAAAAAAGSIEGSKAVIESKMERVNTHLLSPAAIAEIKRVTGATDSEIDILEPHLREFLIHELKQRR